MRCSVPLAPHVSALRKLNYRLSVPRGKEQPQRDTRWCLFFLFFCTTNNTNPRPANQCPAASSAGDALLCPGSSCVYHADLCDDAISNNRGGDAPRYCATGGIVVFVWSSAPAPSMPSCPPVDTCHAACCLLAFFRWLTTNQPRQVSTTTTASVPPAAMPAVAPVLNAADAWCPSPADAADVQEVPATDVAAPYDVVIVLAARPVSLAMSDVEPGAVCVRGGQQGGKKEEKKKKTCLGVVERRTNNSLIPQANSWSPSRTVK